MVFARGLKHDSSAFSDVSDALISKTITKTDSSLQIINFDEALEMGLDVVKDRMKGKVVGVKSRWPKLNKKLGGIMFWQLPSDAPHDGLLNAIHVKAKEE